MMIDFLLRQRCRVRPWQGLRDGQDEYGPEEERACRLQMNRRLENGANVPGVQDVVPARALMFCTGGMIPERSAVECEGERYVVTGCKRVRGFAEEHLEVTLQ